MSKKLEEANAQMKSDMEKMQEELETQDKLRRQQEEQVEHHQCHHLDLRLPFTAFV